MTPFNADLAALRAAYARRCMAWAERSGVPDPRIEAAFAAVRRERYLTPPPWRIFAPGGILDTETSDPAQLYQDVLVVLDRPKGINNGQPSLHAAWMAAVAPQPGEAVVQIGIGTGYFTAILAELVGEGGRVDGYEIEPRLAAIARDNLAGCPAVTVHPTTAVGAVLPAADVVYVAAGAAAPDRSWLKALRPGGRLIMPWQPAPGGGQTLLVEREAGGFAARLSEDVAFVGCVGADHGKVRPRAVPAQPIEATRSLRFTEECPPDGSATAVYADVWFSSDDP